jgi:AraC-like DNA-binding protein
MPDILESFLSDYQTHWPVSMLVTDANGKVVSCRGIDPGLPADFLALVCAEGCRWGEPTICDHTAGWMCWAVPLMTNARIDGGIVAVVSEKEVFPRGQGTPHIDVTKACRDLRESAEAANLTNLHFLSAQRRNSQREQHRAYALHDLKTHDCSNVLGAWLKEEPEFISALSHDDRVKATEIVNRLLVVIYHTGSRRIDLIKSQLLELLVAMVRTAVVSGGASEELLGMNYEALQELGGIHDDEALTSWLVHMLHRIMDAIRRAGEQASLGQIQAGVDYIHKNQHLDISRDDAAAAAGISPCHFSRLLKQRTGYSFTDLLGRLRVDRAISLMRRTDKDLANIALEVGFNDQSYFTKVFRRYTNETPRRYRARMQRRAAVLQEPE